MKDAQRVSITKNTVEVLESLTKAIDQAGGCLDIKYLLNMSLLEFISHVCVPNGVRFSCVETKPVEEYFYEGDVIKNEKENTVTCTRCEYNQFPNHIQNAKWKYYCTKCFALFGKKE